MKPVESLMQLDAIKHQNILTVKFMIGSWHPWSQS